MKNIIYQSELTPLYVICDKYGVRENGMDSAIVIYKGNPCYCKTNKENPKWRDRPERYSVFRDTAAATTTTPNTREWFKLYKIYRLTDEEIEIENKCFAAYVKYVGGGKKYEADWSRPGHNFRNHQGSKDDKIYCNLIKKYVKTRHLSAIFAKDRVVGVWYSPIMDDYNEYIH